jgi:serine/threonine-protein kinase
VLIPGEADRLKFSVKVLDFGIAKMLNEQPLVVTRADRALGTPFYMAPEQWFGGSVIDARTDVYSLGCVFFEILAGRPPFEAEDSLAMMHAHLEEAAPSVRSLAAEAPPALDRLIAQMLAKAPGDRPQSMAEVVAALEAYLERYRQGFDDLLRAPAEHPVAVGAEENTQPTDLGMGPGPSADTTAPVTADAETKRRARIAALAALAVVGLAGLVAAGTLLGREKAAPRAELRLAPPPPPRPAPTPPPLTLPPPPDGDRDRPSTARAPAAPRPAARPRNVYRPVGD